jgi:hypothetical protein
VDAVALDTHRDHGPQRLKRQGTQPVHPISGRYSLIKQVSGRANEWELVFPAIPFND